MNHRKDKESRLSDDPHWYLDVVIYEVHVRAFHDHANDGVGDFRGLTAKLPYLEDLGITAIWLLPFYPSPLRDDGYDIADYLDVHPAYGTLQDFKAFLKEAHRRGIRVITELVLNHTSDQHQWFQEARRARPGSRMRDFYVWSDTPEKYSDARIIFKDFETSNWSWDPIAKAYFWHRFYSHQPDLNFDNPDVRKAMLHAVDFWLDLGVDGLRLDAVPYLYEREGTSCENLPETHSFLRELRAHIDRKYRNRMLLAEANQWPEDAVAYFGNRDECHMTFHFPLMPRLFMATRMESRFPIVDILRQTPRIDDGCQWALFLRNHDELTLEMVTDEERDYMYRVYARDRQARINLGIRRRLAPLLGNDRRRIELMNSLLFSMPGTPVIYYGDEIGMGDNIYLGDRNGVRTPMQWSSDRNAGFSRANPQRVFLPVVIDPAYHYEAINVEAQEDNPSSLLWWMKRLISLRKRYRAFSRGTLEFLFPENSAVLAFTRHYEKETILVVANLSRFSQSASLDLARFHGSVPIEVFGQAPFPPITDAPYPLTIGPHSFFWFTLESKQEPGVMVDSLPAALPAIEARDSWEDVLAGDDIVAAIHRMLPEYLQSRRWFGGKARRVRNARVTERIQLDSDCWIWLVHVEYSEGEPETYVLPVALSTGERAALLLKESPRMAIATVASRDASGIIHDASWLEEFRALLVQLIRRRKTFHGKHGRLAGRPFRSLRALLGQIDKPLPSALPSAEQSNTSIVYDNTLMLKLFRKLDDGTNPDLEIGLYLTERASFRNIPPVAGAIEYHAGGGEPKTLCMLQAYVPNEGDAWKFTLRSLGRFFERALARRSATPPECPALDPLLAPSSQPIQALAGDILGTYYEAAQTLGRRTAELHLALSADTRDEAFAPEPFTPHYQRSIYQSIRALLTRELQRLRSSLSLLDEATLKDAQRVLALEDELERRVRPIIGMKLSILRTRCHGDFHLGQVLYTGKDFVIIDFEGEPARPIGERRIKRSPLRDVAGMVRSFHYAAYSALNGQQVVTEPSGRVRPEDFEALGPWARCWHTMASAVYLQSYLEVAGDAKFVPRERRQLVDLLRIYLVEKAIYELGYELNNRPTWVSIPLAGLLGLVETSP
jgi:maltose alpha-D-glucosyltransferase/alpha-amylase